TVAAAGGQTHSSRQHQRGLVPAENPTSESVSSSEEDMTWEDFLATTDDLTNSSGDASAGAPAVPPPAGRRRGNGGTSLGSSTKNAAATHSRLPHSLAPNQSQVTRIPVSSGSGLYPRGPSDDSAVSAGAAAAGVLSRSGGAPSGGGSGVGRSGGSQGALLASRGKEAGAGYGSGFTSWGKGGGKDAEADDPESADSVVSGYDGSVAGGGAQALTWGQFVVQHKEVKAPGNSIRVPKAVDPPRKASADSDDFDDDEDDDIDDIMSTFGPVSLRPDQDDILFSHKEEELLLMMDRSSELGRGRGPGIDVVAVAAKVGAGRGINAKLADESTAVGGAFFGSGDANGGKIPGGIRGGNGNRGTKVTGGANGSSRIPPPPSAGLHKHPAGLEPFSAAPPAYSAAHRQHPPSDSLPPPPPPPMPMPTPMLNGGSAGHSA
ncbi:unnamed protein product, partial [Sphacelaria rigidula]